MNLELSDFNERIRLLRRIRSRGREDYLIGNQRKEEKGGGNSIFNLIDLDGDSSSATKCLTFNFVIEVSALRDRSEDQTYDSYTMA
ncbi:hypothetical protein MTR_3g076850 [Medicago truncatula]|uniref:Uncharacterized protein n=1 Tax=Medicago truncatula TaxID=3880 RepID=G7J4A3_MEDTR|nr:hypothetical protein MTR_3g076850 [Medicago truncatula]